MEIVFELNKKTKKSHPEPHPILRFRENTD